MYMIMISDNKQQINVLNKNKTNYNSKIRITKLEQ